MNPKDIMASDISYAEKDKHCMTSLICGITFYFLSQMPIKRVENWFPRAWGWGQ